MRRPAFTLIELLITTSVLVVVSLLATGVLAATVQLQLVSSHNQNVSASLDEVQAAISRDLQASAFTPGSALATAQILYLDQTNTLNYLNDNALVIQVPYQDPATGVVDSTQSVWHIYCAENSGANAPKLMVRYVFAKSAFSLPISASQCSLAQLPQVGYIQTDYLTEKTVSALNFRAWPVWQAAQADNSKPFEAVQVELTAQYQPVVGAVENRSSLSAAVPPLHIRFLVNRKSVGVTNGY